MGQVVVPVAPITPSTIINPVNVTGTEPRIIFTETDAVAGRNKWDLDVQASVFSLRTRTAADGAGVTILSATQLAGSLIGNVTLTAGVGASSPANRLRLIGRSVDISATAGFDDQDGLFIHNSATNGTVSIAADGTGGSMSFDATADMAFNSDSFELNGTTSISLTAGDISLFAIGADGDINLNISGTGTVNFGTQLGNFANDAAAAAGGIPVQGLYRNGSVVMIRVV